MLASIHVCQKTFKETSHIYILTLIMHYCNPALTTQFPRELNFVVQDSIDNEHAFDLIICPGNVSLSYQNDITFVFNRHERFSYILKGNNSNNQN